MGGFAIDWVHIDNWAALPRRRIVGQGLCAPPNTFLSAGSALRR